MKLPSYLVKSRHGVFYFRLTVRNESGVHEKRFSLGTREPHQAKLKALYISAELKGSRVSTDYDPNKLNLDDLSTYPSDERLRQEIAKGDAIAKALLDIKSRHQSSADRAVSQSPVLTAEDARSLQIIVGNSTLIADPNDPADLNAALAMAKALGADAKAGTPQEFEITKQIGTSEEQPKTKPSGFTLDEMIGRYLARSKGRLATKTHYEYGRMLKKFEVWLYAKKSANPYFVRQITRVDIADFIDDLMAEGLTASVIQKKYLAVLNGVFGLAQTLSAIPAGDLPTSNHKIFTKRDQKKSHHLNGYKPYSDDELAQIFNHENLLALEQPADFWLPLLGLHTGARISELTQLLLTDIKMVDGIWAIDINEETQAKRTSVRSTAKVSKPREELAKSLKNSASVRKIPLHPTLIKIGFLDYVELVRPYRGDLFPYLNADTFGNKSGRPSERFGKYLDSLKITSKNKVFHSFRSTANDLLKQAGVPEETRCQFVGHEHNTVNSRVYSQRHTVEFLLNNVADKLVFPHLKLDDLKAPIEKQKAVLAHEVRKSERIMNHKAKSQDMAKRLDKQRAQ